jgi:hypothetical protein
VQGRATLEMKVAASSTPEGPQDVTLTLVLDGYNAPVSAGQFMDLVQRRFYDGMAVQRADGFVVQTGDPDGPEDGWVDPATGAVRRCGAVCGAVWRCVGLCGAVRVPRRARVFLGGGGCRQQAGSAAP